MMTLLETIRGGAGELARAGGIEAVLAHVKGWRWCDPDLMASLDRTFPATPKKPKA